MEETVLVQVVVIPKKKKKKKKSCQYVWRLEALGEEERGNARFHLVDGNGQPQRLVAHYLLPRSLWEDHQSPLHLS